MPQPPQFAGSMTGSTHPFAQGVRPPLHRHVPLMQPWPGAHTWPHAPQFVRSVERFVQSVPQSVMPANAEHVHRPR